MKTERTEEKLKKKKTENVGTKIKNVGTVSREMRKRARKFD